jgi:hypothetical protein
VSGTRWKFELHERTLDLIRPDCCGPEDGVWDRFTPYWVCDYHCGYDDGLDACRETGGTP